MLKCLYDIALSNLYFYVIVIKRKALESYNASDFNLINETRKMIKKDKKKKIIEKFKTHKEDTGSSEVQVAVLTERIKELTEHLKVNKKDNHSRRGLLQMVAKRKKLLKDIRNNSEERFGKIAKSLKLKAAKTVKKEQG